jgi:hypothetical protein
MRKLISLAGTTLLLLSLGACTSNYSITMVHSEGVATDVVDETDTATPTNDISPTLSIPASAL